MVSGTGWRRADAESQDRDVVVEAVAEALQQGADAADGGGRGGRREAGGERQKRLIAVALPSLAGASFGQPVGVQQECVAGAEPDRGRGEDHIVDDAEERAAADRLVVGGAVSPKQQRRGMTAAGEAEIEAVRARGENPEGRRAETAAVTFVVPAQRAVEGAEHRRRVWVVDGGGAQGVADLRGHGGRGRALAAYVAQEQAPPIPGEGEQVVEVAAYLIPG